MRKIIFISTQIISFRNIPTRLLNLSIKFRYYNALNQLSTTTTRTAAVCAKAPNVSLIARTNNKIYKQCYQADHDRQFTTTFALAKGKDRGKDKKKMGSKHSVDTKEMSQVLDVEQLTKECEKQVEIFKNNLIKHASLRPTSGAIEELPVSYDGTTYALHELANIVRKSNVIVISITDFPQVIPNILESFKRHEIKLNPQQDGTTIYITLPKITKELRQLLIKSTNAMFIKSRDNIKEVRNKNVKKLKKNEENHPIDLLERVQKSLEAFIQQYIDQIAGILEKKQKELQGEGEE